MSLLIVRGLSTAYPGRREVAWAVRDASFRLERDETVGIVGESGSGKTTLVMSILRLIKPPGRILTGEVRFEDEDLFKRRRASLRKLRGTRISLVPQAAMNALDPVFTVERLVAEAIEAHREIRRREAQARARGLLESVGIPEERARAYPHELSGGMRQRAVIALALANDPCLLIADEPVTGLDVIVQAQVLELLGDLRRRRGLAMIFVSHDLSVVAAIADRLLVMHGGRIVEEGAVEKVLNEPSHPHTQSLVAAAPSLDGPPGEVT